MAEYILEAGGTMAFTFHVLFMLFNLFIIYQFYFNDKFFNENNFLFVVYESYIKE